MKTTTLAEQIAELERELRLRRSCYPKWVESKRLSQTNADHQIACLEGAIENLRELALLGAPWL